MFACLVSMITIYIYMVTIHINYRTEMAPRIQIRKISNKIQKAARSFLEMSSMYRVRFLYIPYCAYCIMCIFAYVDAKILLPIVNCLRFHVANNIDARLQPAGDKEEDSTANDDGQEPSIPTTGKYDDGLCCICYNSPQVNKSFPPCQHTFCFECLLKWCIIKNHCPICHEEIHKFYYSGGRETYEPAKHRTTEFLHHRISNRFHYLRYNGDVEFLFNVTRSIRIVRGNVDVIRWHLTEMVIETERESDENRITQIGEEMEELRRIYECVDRIPLSAQLLI